MLKLLNEFKSYQEPSAGVNEEPEQETDIFGRYAFDAERDDIPQDQKEDPTPEEKKALMALRSYITVNRKTALDQVAPTLVDLVKQGKYKPVLDPSGTSTVYRIMQMDHVDVSKLLGTTVDDQHQYGKTGPGTLAPSGGSSISGWTSDINLVREFHGATDAKNTLVLFKAQVKGNTFFGKPRQLAMAIDPDMAHESETIAVGPVKYDMAVWAMQRDTTNRTRTSYDAPTMLMRQISG